MNEKEVLEAARALISDPKHWTQGALARNANDDQCFPNSKRAVQWCAIGAIEHVTGDLVAKRGARMRLQSAAQCLYHDVCENALMLPAAAVNDELDHAAVMKMYDVAIASWEPMLKSEEPKGGQVIPFVKRCPVEIEEIEHGNA